jgi:hypothetical protein
MVFSCGAFISLVASNEFMRLSNDVSSSPRKILMVDILVLYLVRRCVYIGEFEGTIVHSKILEALRQSLSFLDVQDVSRERVSSRRDATS